MLHGLCFGEEAGARNLVFFRVKWLQPAMKGTSSVRRLRLGSFLSRIVPSMCFATSGCSCVRSSMRFLKLWLLIVLAWLHECCMGCVLEWLHPGCDSDLSADFLNFGASDFRLKIPFKNCFKIFFFSLASIHPVLELQFPTLLRVVLLRFATQSLQIAMAASRLLGAAAAYGILLSFAA